MVSDLASGKISIPMAIKQMSILINIASVEFTKTTASAVRKYARMIIKMFLFFRLICLLKYNMPKIRLSKISTFNPIHCLLNNNVKKAVLIATHNNALFFFII